MPSRETPLRVAIIFGGDTTEHVISLRSARAVMAAADRLRIEPVPVAVGRHGVWHSIEASAALVDAMDHGAPECIPGSRGPHGLLAAPQALRVLTEVDAAFPLIHGTGGEDGSLQGLLELVGVPYVGAGVAASAVGMDKALMKAVFRDAGLPVPDARVVSADAWSRDEAAIMRALAELPMPLFAKPANGGSSVGIVKIHTREEIVPAIAETLRFDRTAIVETGINGREIECAVLERPARLGGGAESSLPGEILYGRDFYDYAAKYEDPETELVLTPKLPAGIAEQAQKLALAAFDAIGCAGFARVDFFLDGQNTLWVNEINTIPGFTSASMFPRLWEAAGLRFDQLIERLLQVALDRAEASRSLRLGALRPEEGVANA
jgi:D-alanine-D-alanine ligase